MNNQHLHILHIEDDSTDAELIQTLLRRQGIDCQIDRVQTRKEFIDAMDRDGFDLILSDFSMPGFDGLSALAIARERCPDVPFIFVSGTLGEDVAIDSLRRGATDYLLKDRPSRLGAAIRRAMEDVEEREALQRAEESMTQSESKYRQLFECLADAAILTDAATGRIIDANQQAETLLHRTRGEIIGVNENLILSPATSEAFHKRFDGASDEKGHVRLYGEVVAKNGRTVPVNMSASPLTLYGRQLVLEIFHEPKQTAAV